MRRMAVTNGELLRHTQRRLATAIGAVPDAVDDLG